MMPPATDRDQFPPLRVLMTADAIGGVWTYAMDLCRGLGGEGVEVVLAVMGTAPSADQRAEAEALPNVSLHEGSFRLEWMNDPWPDVAAAGDWLLALARDRAVDLVHLNGFVHAALPWPVPVLVVGHSCVLSWWRAVHGTDAPESWRRYAAEVARGLQAASLVVAPTQAMLDALTRHYGPLPATAVVRNGRRPPAAAPSSARQPLVLGVGRLWDEAKNARALAAVAPDLAWPVLLAGDTRGPTGAETSLPGVRLLGQCRPAALAREYARASIFASPARYEPFGLSILEAAQAGCALVLGDIESLRELWEGAAVFVRPDDRDALRRILQRLIVDEAGRSALAAAAHARSRQYSIARLIASYRSIYDELAGAPARRRRRVVSSFS